MKKEKSLTVVIKLGTSSIVDEKTHEPLLSVLSGLVETATRLRHAGHKVVLVSSGAIGVGLRRMDMEKKPKHLPIIQALAAIGQCRLMTLWDQLFSHLRQPVAQILLTRGDFADRTRYQNAQNTLFQLLEMGVIPIVNENDTLAVAEIKFGDNDTLSAITAGMVHADYLFLMTDVDCLYDKNPRTHSDAKPIEVVKDISSLSVDVSSKGSSLGTGGMRTKIVAARLATSAGVMTVITRSSQPGNIFDVVNYVEGEKAAHATQKLTMPDQRPTAQRLQSDIFTQPLSNSVESLSADLGHAGIGETLSKENNSQITLVADSAAEPAAPVVNGTAERKISIPLHTRFEPEHPIRDRSFWILHVLAPHGSLFIDEGAFKALATVAGLRPVGVVDCEGNFASHECVNVCVVQKTMAYDESGVYRAVFDRSNLEVVGKALVNYSSTEIKRIKGLKRKDITNVLGYSDSEYIALRENIAFYRPKISRPVTPLLEHPPATLTSSPATPEVFGIRSP